MIRMEQMLFADDATPEQLARGTSSFNAGAGTSRFAAYSLGLLAAANIVSAFVVLATNPATEEDLGRMWLTIFLPVGAIQCVCIAALISWLVQAHRNMKLLGATPRYSSVRAVAAFLLSVTNIIHPLEMVRELISGAAPKPRQDILPLYSGTWTAGFIGSLCLPLGLVNLVSPGGAGEFMGKALTVLGLLLTAATCFGVIRIVAAVDEVQRKDFFHLARGLAYSTRVLASTRVLRVATELLLILSIATAFASFAIVASAAGKPSLRLVVGLLAAGAAFSAFFLAYAFFTWWTIAASSNLRVLSRGGGRSRAEALMLMLLPGFNLLAAPFVVADLGQFTARPRNFRTVVLLGWYSAAFAVFIGVSAPIFERGGILVGARTLLTAVGAAALIICAVIFRNALVKVARPLEAIEEASFAQQRSLIAERNACSLSDKPVGGACTWTELLFPILSLAREGVSTFEASGMTPRPQMDVQGLAKNVASTATAVARTSYAKSAKASAVAAELVRKYVPPARPRSPRPPSRLDSIIPPTFIIAAIGTLLFLVAVGPAMPTSSEPPRSIPRAMAFVGLVGLLVSLFGSLCAIVLSAIWVRRHAGSYGAVRWALLAGSGKVLRDISGEGVSRKCSMLWLVTLRASQACALATIVFAHQGRPDYALDAAVPATLGWIFACAMFAKIVHDVKKSMKTK